MAPKDRPAAGNQELALELFQGLAGCYESALDLATVYQDRYWKRWAASEALVRDGGNVLDVGCGTLVFEERALPRSCRAVGLDLTREMLALGRSKRLGMVEGLLEGDAEFLPFGGGSFDAAVSCYVAKYVDLERFVGEMARVVRPGGRVVVYDFARPRGAARVPLYSYLFGVIGPVGRVLKLARSKSAFTFLNLPRIVEEADWDQRIGSVARSAGLELVTQTRLTGGAVVGFSAVKPRDLSKSA